MRDRPVVVVVAYGAPQHLHLSLAPLADTHHVLVVDNSSRVDVRQVAVATGATYVDPGANLGFAAGVNYAMRRVPANSDVLLLNPDASLVATDLARLHDALYEDDRSAAVSPALRDPNDGSPQRVAWPFPTPGRMWLQALVPGWRGPAEYVVGTCLLMRRAAWDDVGAFDERFFLYAEETDWQFRARRRGWGVRVVPGVWGTHVGAGTSEDSTRRDSLFDAAAETYIRKWYGGLGWMVYRLAAVLGATLRVLLGGRSTRAAAWPRLRRYLRGPRQVAGLA